MVSELTEVDPVFPAVVVAAAILEPVAALEDLAAEAPGNPVAALEDLAAEAPVVVAATAVAQAALPPALV